MLTKTELRVIYALILLLIFAIGIAFGVAYKVANPPKTNTAQPTHYEGLTLIKNKG